VAAALPVTGRRLLCIQTMGNRHVAHAAAVAPVLAETFDGFIVGCDPVEIERGANYSGDDPVAAMLIHTRQRLLDSGISLERLTAEADPVTAIRMALSAAAPGDLVVLLAEPAMALPIIEEFIADLG